MATTNQSPEQERSIKLARPRPRALGRYINQDGLIALYQSSLLNLLDDKHVDVLLSNTFAAAVGSQPTGPYCRSLANKIHFLPWGGIFSPWIL